MAEEGKTLDNELEEPVEGLEETDEGESKDEDLQAQLDALKKERDGLYKEMISERRTRQELKSQIENINNVLSEIKAKKEELPADQGSIGGGVPVRFNDDGDPYIDPKDLEGVIAPVKGEIENIKGETFNQALVNENTKIINEVLQSDPMYPVGYQKVQQAWAYLDKEFEKMVNQSGIDPKTLNLDIAADMLENSDVAQEFAERFPGLDIDMVLDANSRGPNGLVSTRKLRKAIKAAVAASPEESKKFDNLKLLAGKPRNLAGQANRKGASGRTLNDVADISVEDFMNLSDSDVAKLERALRNAEK